jgi:hypothetical protein
MVGDCGMGVAIVVILATAVMVVVSIDGSTAGGVVLEMLIAMLVLLVL